MATTILRESQIEVEASTVEDIRGIYNYDINNLPKNSKLKVQAVNEDDDVVSIVTTEDTITIENNTGISWS